MKSRCLLQTKKWVHNFLDDPNNILRIKLEGKGNASFKVVDTDWYVGLGDYLLTMSEDGENKVIYQIIQIDMSREVKVGQVIDLCAIGKGKISAEAERAILLMDQKAVEKGRQERMERHNAQYM